MKLLILACGGYPSKDNYYNGGFIHTRVKKYIEQGHTCVVFIPSKVRVFGYDYDGVHVTVGNYLDLERAAFLLRPDRVLVHFMDPIAFRFLNEHNIPSIAWVHGYGAIGWWRYPFDFKFSIKYLLFVYVSMKNLFKFHSLSKFRHLRFVFVSKWMKKTAEHDTFSKIKAFSIIPNPIDEKLFNYREKSAEDRRHILLIRSFNSLKYSPDVAIDTILELSKRPIFKNLFFTIYGQGEYFYLTNLIKLFVNIHIVNKFITPEEIAALHKRHGIFLCPTRMDAQGVSMCEAMMSGLVPITSKSTAIPEFVQSGFNGYSGKNCVQLADRIETLYKYPELFSSLSRQAHNSIVEKAGSETAIQKELEYIHYKNR